MNWLTRSLVFLMGATSPLLNSLHARQGNPTWTGRSPRCCFVTIMWLSTCAPVPAVSHRKEATASLRFAQAEGFDRVHDIVRGPCACHAAEPADGLPLGRAKPRRSRPKPRSPAPRKQIYLQAVVKSSPLANLSICSSETRRDRRLFQRGTWLEDLIRN